MNIALVLSSNFENAPFYRIYKRFLEKHHDVNITYIIWNRNMKKNHPEQNVISYDEADEIDSGKIGKFFKYIKYGKFVQRCLSNKKYDKILFLGSYAWTMVLLASYMKKNYQGKYWFDIRDYSFEYIPFYYKGMKKAINNSYHTVISSPAFKQFLPKYDYSIIHNIDISNIERSIEKRNTNYHQEEPIRISFIGTFGYMPFQEKLINKLGNDSRFMLQYFGTSVDKAKDYCEKNNITNICFEGTFPSEKTPDYYARTDIINNIYGNDSFTVNTALSNKLYYSLALKMPILVCKDTYMEHVTQEAGNGFTFDFTSDNVSDNLYDWYIRFFKSKHDKCDELFKTFSNENRRFYKKLNEYIYNKEK